MYIICSESLCIFTKVQNFKFRILWLDFFPDIVPPSLFYWNLLQLYFKVAVYRNVVYHRGAFLQFFWSLLMQYRCWLGLEYPPVFPLLLFFLLDQRMQKGLAELQICFPGGPGLCAGFTRCLVAMQVCQVWCYGLPMLMFIQEGPLLPEQREGASQLWKHC